MQDRYAGDVGDFVKLGLLRAIAPGRNLGVAWYRHPDEPHNGDGRRKGRTTFGKQIPISEALRLSEGRTAVIYHHNTRRSGGHDAEVDHWISTIGAPCIAVRARAYNCRTFFIFNPDTRM